jgi:hypothetical protein
MSAPRRLISTRPNARGATASNSFARPVRGAATSAVT